MNFLREHKEALLAIGLVIMLIGIALSVSFDTDFESLPNYKRLALLIPLFFGGALVSLSNLADWDETSGWLKGRSIGVLIGFVLIVIGTVAWWLLAPDAKS